MKPPKVKTVSVLAATLTVGALIYAVAQGYGRAVEPVQRYSYINEALAALEQRAPIVTWEPERRPLVRPFTDFDAERIGEQLTSAWRSLALASETGESAVLADYFTGVALRRARISATDAHSQHTGMVMLTQTARPTMFHLDGTVFQCEVEALVARFALNADGTDVIFDLSRDRLVSTLMNETTGWRVSNHERRASEPVAPAPARYTAGILRGVNYYPAATPWTRFWPEYDPAVVKRDLERVAELGGNAIRIFLPRKDFIDPALAKVHTASLVDLLAQADDAGLKVIVTLFDMKHDYFAANWFDDIRVIHQLAPVLNIAQNIAVIDIKNEPDLDFDIHGRGMVLAWLQSMMAVLRAEVPSVPLTVGWSSAGAAPILADRLDVISYHDYENLEEVGLRLAQTQQLGGQVPVMVTEIGASSWTLAAGLPGSPRSQAQVLGHRLQSLTDADGVFVWTLNDFPEPDPVAIGQSPWRRRLQSAFGLLDADGTEKPAAGAVRDAFVKVTAGDES